MIVSIYLKEHQYLIEEPQTLNFGGKYLYSYLPVGDDLIIRKKLNEKHIPDFFNISDSNCKINLLSAVVGQNGVGKSSILDVIRGIFVEHVYSMPHSISTVLVEVEGETKVLYTNCKTYIVVDDDNEKTDASIRRDFRIKNILDLKDEDEKNVYEELEEINLEDYQSLYYSPHFDLKYNNDFDEVDKYDISLDQFIKQDLEDTDNKGTNENGWRFPLHEELVFKNSMRQIDFLSSSIFKDNIIFREVFDLPQYETGILHFRDVEMSDFHNTPNPLRPIIKLILEKVETESSQWHSIRKFDKNHNVLNQNEVNKYLLERFVIKAFISIVVQQMEKENTWLEEGKIDNPYDLSRFKENSAIELLFYFIKESYIEKANFKKSIFISDEIIPFFEKLEILFSKETDPYNITKQSIRLNLEEVKEILNLHRNIILNLRNYFPTFEGLHQDRDYIDGFISFRPTDRSLSSGENALLNFFSKLYSFIKDNLIEESKSLPDRKNYIILLDEADLGFHPVWKKRYVEAILKTIPYFFELLEVKPKIQIIITTHDPLTLSDLPINNVVFLYKDNSFCRIMSNDDQNKIQKTFGANITDLLAHSFFVEDGLIGDFSKSKIKEVINWISKSKELSEDAKSSKLFLKQLEYYKSVINIIDEKFVKIKLAEMITDLVPDNEYYNQVIDKEIELLRNKKK
ncbi:AAA family ATPase [Flavobacterium columnare]|uniref:ATP-binding protein n=1 Tax=Flavobacterium columnare TaxID=996 RepID=A0AA94EZT9_9FLAO|nr:AAA family ATPase [Flavobacterium columnare]MCH4830617.1 AAA family ATPase [Flavobacterium columnare]MCH4833447.1 AAA family ATPase [Flavobacterium columnare]